MLAVGKAANMSTSMGAFADAQIRTLLRVYLQRAVSTTVLGWVLAWHVTVRVVQLLGLLHRVVAETLAAVLHPRDLFAHFDATRGTILSSRTIAPFVECTNGPIRHEVAIAALVLPCLPTSGDR